MDILFIIIIAALIATSLAMTIGISAMGSGGGVDKEFSTTLMWVRVGLQGLTVGLLLLALFLR